MNSNEKYYLQMIEQFNMEHEIYEAVLTKKYESINEGFAEKIKNAVLTIIDNIILWIKKIRIHLSNKWKKEYKDFEFNMKYNGNTKQRNTVIKNIYGVDLSKYGLQEFVNFEYPSSENLNMFLKILIRSSTTTVDNVIKTILDYNIEYPEKTLYNLNMLVFDNESPILDSKIGDYKYLHIFKKFFIDNFNANITDSKELHVDLKLKIDNCKKEALNFNTYDLFKEISIIKSNKPNIIVSNYLINKYTGVIIDSKKNVDNSIQKYLSDTENDFKKQKARMQRIKENIDPEMAKTILIFITKYSMLLKDFDLTFSISNIYNNIIENCNSYLYSVSGVYEREIKNIHKYI